MTAKGPQRWWPAAVALVQALLVLGPALGPGVVIAYDMPWSPDARWTPFVLGQDTPAPRVVPSDAVMVLFGKVLGAGLVQSLVLFAIIMGLGLGAVALLDHLAPNIGVVGRCACVVAAVWNPFVSERLVIGQWVVVLGLAVLPWALRATLRALARTGSRYAVGLALLVAGVGGVNTVTIVVLAVVPLAVAAVAVQRSRRAAEIVALTVAMTLGVSAVWALPGLFAGAEVSGTGAASFAPTSDTPLGVWGSMLSGGGFWNGASHPNPRGVLLIAVLAGLLSVVAVGCLTVELRRARLWLPAVPVLAAVALVTMSTLPFTRGLWTTLVTGLPGGGVLRDSQKFLAIWVLIIALGVGVLVDRALATVPHSLAGPVAVGIIGLVVGLSPQMFWGIGGRLDAVQVPEGYRSAVAQLSGLPRGEVGLLPWNQYRRYGWNESRVSLTLGPRIIDQQVLFDDSLPLRAGSVPGESERAARVTERITQGYSPVEALRSEGVRYLAAELDTGLDLDVEALRGAGRVVVDDENLLVVDAGSRDVVTEGSGWTGLLGWLISTAGGVAFLTWGVVVRVSRRLPAGLLTFRP